MTTAVQADLVRFAGVTKTYSNGFTALAPIDLTIGPGKVVSIVGPSGCGKTTLLRMAGGLSSPTTGELSIGSTQNSYVFQDPTLMAWRNVLANTELVSRIRKVPRAETRRRAVEALRLVGLENVQKSLPRELSGGMRMRVSLARALASEPDLMLMDEPFAALDEFTRDRMADELIRLWRERRFGVLFITHSIREAVKIAHEVVVMASGPGRIVEIVESPSPPGTDPDAARDTDALDETVKYIGARLAAA
ncbi:ABC transporter ATP-binding protein [Pseudonocardia halophobica]|uniref:ABC transporter ATP-binding protein n=1 Tax=Pseudonocardia halophobica TaxID=29401 RepID=A0A9W6LBC5_9PSEU|nr:ABC transporter ATP-binding protein [Pseudonocardia halophobica]GLL14960.1 ABC transporter ATP-binding protein [Pseudonocardia halophobica]